MLSDTFSRQGLAPIKLKSTVVLHIDQPGKIVVAEHQGVKSEKDLAALTQDLLKITVEASLNAEMDEHLGYVKHSLKAMVPVTVAMAMARKK
jgi:hypothetical protein